MQADSLQSQIEATQRQIADPRPAREHDSFREPRRAEVAPAKPAPKPKGLRERLAAPRRGADGDDLPLPDDRGDRAQARSASSPLDDIKNVLAWEAIALLYLLVVAGPFLILGFLVWLALRLRRRHVHDAPARAELGERQRQLGPHGRADTTLARDTEAARRAFPLGRAAHAGPIPPGAAPPTPSSETSTTRTPSSQARLTWARLAAAYLATFASDSETT